MSARPAPPFLLYGILLFCTGLAIYLFGVLLAIPRVLFGLNALLLPLNEAIVWYSGVPVMIAFVLVLLDLFVLFGRRRNTADVRYDPIAHPAITVALTAYNDEDSIAAAVADFRAHPLVRRIIVVSNSSRDATMARAREAGAIVVNEPLQGYGRCVYRALSEAAQHADTPLVVLCEGDQTFRSYDIDKFVAYAPHADIVNGTRTVEKLRQYRTQLSTFMFYGNVFVGKLLEARHLGKGTFSDVGTTYKLCRRDALLRLLPALEPRVNLEFNAHFLDTALRHDFAVVECPITFHPRVGVSKGGNVNNGRALKVGIRMIFGIVFGWRALRT